MYRTHLRPERDAAKFDVFEHGLSKLVKLALLRSTRNESLHKRSSQDRWSSIYLLFKRSVETSKLLLRSKLPVGSLPLAALGSCFRLNSCGEQAGCVTSSGDACMWVRVSVTVYHDTDAPRAILIQSKSRHNKLQLRTALKRDPSGNKRLSARFTLVYGQLFSASSPASALRLF